MIVSLTLKIIVILIKCFTLPGRMDEKGSKSFWPLESDIDYKFMFKRRYKAAIRKKGKGKTSKKDKERV